MLFRVILTFILGACLTSPAIASGGEIRLTPQRAGKLIHQAPDYAVHLSRDHRGEGGCSPQSEGGSRFFVTVIRDMGLNEKITEQWLWGALRPSIKTLLSQHCPNAAGASVKIYIKGVDMTESGWSYPISKFPAYYYDRNLGTFTSKVGRKTVTFPKGDFPTHSVANASFNFIDRMTASWRNMMLDPEQIEARKPYPSSEIKSFSQDPYNLNSYNFWGADGSFTGLLERRKLQTARHNAIHAQRKRERDAQIGLLLGFMSSMDEYIWWSHCHPRANDVRSLSTPSLACQKSFPDLRDGAHPYRP